MNRRTFIKKGLGSIVGLVGLSSGTYYYARNIEPNMLHIQQETIFSNKFSAAFNNFRIVQFSDTHAGFHYSMEDINALMQQINALKPDLIVFTGDLVDAPNQYNWYPNLIEALTSINAEYGKYWIYGNHDHGGYGTDIIHDVMERSNFTLLKNSHVAIQKENDRIIIAGIDDMMLGNPNIQQALHSANPELFIILLAHAPDYADTTVKYPVDIQLSGHSHGGQVRFPFIGHLYTPAYAEKFVQGKYSLKNDKLIVYVNKGIGTTRLPYRFLCKPELHVYTLQNKG
ncbi:metallophosphoesterase [Oceanobacillus chungangensis]|uniref:Metallophosphoesterase n=1 Tax=Oceanobacillus chungangensis TaxID=1229152 RepID=A0A3D8PPE5_9BACI|nr:metallophosphoesterase [Oceanobacillus chungangensis]RDW17983.1 metallophosphoesterase [Oceanobacillus chungangensis]